MSVPRKFQISKIQRRRESEAWLEIMTPPVLARVMSLSEASRFARVLKKFAAGVAKDRQGRDKLRQFLARKFEEHFAQDDDAEETEKWHVA